MVTLKYGYHVVTLEKQCQVVVDQTRSIVEARVSDMQAIAFSAMPIRVYLDERHGCSRPPDRVMAAAVGSVEG